MYTQAYEIMNKVTSETANSLRQVADQNLKASQKFLSMQAEWTRQAIQFGVDQAQLVADSREPRTFIKDQSTLVGDYIGQCLNNSQELLTAAISNGTEAREWVEQGVEKAQSTLRKATAKKAA